MELNEVKSDNDAGKANFKPKGLRGLFHNLKNGLRNVRQNIQNSLNSGIKVLWRSLLAAVAPYIIGGLIVIGFANLFVYAIHYDKENQLVGSVNSYYSPDRVGADISSNAKETFNESGSLVFATNNDVENISEDYLESLEQRSNSLYEVFMEDGYIGNHYIPKIPYTDGFNIKNAYEFMLNSERMNFNRIRWKEITRSETPEIKDLELITDEETNLKYPNNDEDEKDLDDFVGMVTPYLQSYVIPTSMISGVSSVSNGNNLGNFGFQIIDKAYHQIQINQYTLQNVTRHSKYRKYASLTVTLPVRTWKVERECVDDDTGEKKDCSYYKSAIDASSYATALATVMNNYHTNIEGHERIYDTADGNLIESELYLDTSKYEPRIDDKDIVYALVEAETLKKYISVDYKHELYKEDDVSAYKNEDVFTILERQAYQVNHDTSSQGEISGETTITLQYGEDFTYRYYWADHLNMIENISRNYTTDDVVAYINTGNVEKAKRIIEYTEEEIQKSKKEEPEYDILLSSNDEKYYDSLVKDDELTKIDIINAKADIYNDYRNENTAFSKNIGFSRRELKQSYEIMNRYLSTIVDTVDVESELSALTGSSITIKGMHRFNMACSFKY